jgi:hyperosmotically inducible protein
MKRVAIIVAVLLFGFAGSLNSAPAQIGERVDRALDRLGDNIREGWEEARSAVNRMGLQARVYSRLRWDKALENETIEIDVQASDAVLLRGNVQTDAAKHKAIALARETVGVARVVDELTVAVPAAEVQRQR